MPPQDGQKGAFARAGLPHDADKLAGFNRQVDPAQRPYFTLA